jgi:2-methylisocitrate lyase-like PEP mutase family enzyme
LPVLLDVDDGYGDAKNVTRTVQEYVRLGDSAIFMEHQQPPKKCGHLPFWAAIEKEFEGEHI